MKKSVISLIILLLLLYSPNAIVSLIAGEAHPSISNTNFIIYRPTDGGLENQTISVFPVTFHIMYSGEEEHEINAFWGPFEDPGAYKYEVVSKEWSFSVEPKQIYEGPYGRFLMTYFVSVSAVPYATKTWWGWFSERVKVVVSATVYVRIDRPPTTPVTVSLSEIIGTSRIPVTYSVEVRRVSPSTSSNTVSGVVDLIAEAPLKFFKLSIYWTRVDVTGSAGYGKFSDNNYILVSPVGDIVVGMCLDRPPYIPPGEPPLIFEGKLVFRNQYQTSEASVKLDSLYIPCGEFRLKDVILSPGSYRGNNSLLLSLKSGAFEVSIPAEVDVYGALIAASTPVVLVKPEYDESLRAYRWAIETQIPVNVISYGGYAGSIKVDGNVRIWDSVINISCGWMSYSSPGLYRCKTYSTYPPYNPSSVYNGTSSLTVYLMTAGEPYYDTTTLNVVFLTHTSMQFIVSSIYGHLVMAVLSLLLFAVAFHILQTVLGFFNVSQFLNTIQLLLTATVLSVLVLGLPYAYTAILSTICSITADPQLSDFVRAMGCPISFTGMKPEDAIAKLFSYYDLIISRTRADYMIWVKRSLDEFSFRLTELIAIFMILFGAAMVMMLSMNAPVAGSIASVVLTFAFSIISVIVALSPMLSLLLVFISLVEVMLVVVAVLMLVLIFLGAILLLSPSPSLQVYGENILGAGFFYLLLSPGLAPIMYGLYIQTAKVLEEGIALVASQVGPLSIPLARSIYPPLDLIMRISGYVVLTSIVLGSIVLIHIYLLTRTGIMSSIGESLVRILRR